MDVFSLLVIGLIVGLLTNLFVGGAGYGLPRDILTGAAGAILGSWLFGALGIPVLLGGIGGTSFVAFIGAVALILLLRVIRNARRTRDRWTRSPATSTPWRPVKRSS